MIISKQFTATTDKDLLKADGTPKTWSIEYDLLGEDIKDKDERLQYLIDTFTVEVILACVIKQLLVSIRAKMGVIIKKNPNISDEDLQAKMLDKNGEMYKPKAATKKKAQEDKFLEFLQAQQKAMAPEAFTAWLREKYGIKLTVEEAMQLGSAEADIDDEPDIEDPDEDEPVETDAEDFKI